jgi:hypothetical protein
MLIARLVAWIAKFCPLNLGRRRYLGMSATSVPGAAQRKYHRRQQVQDLHLFASFLSPKDLLNWALADEKAYSLPIAQLRTISIT